MLANQSKIFGVLNKVLQDPVAIESAVSLALRVVGTGLIFYMNILFAQKSGIAGYGYFGVLTNFLMFFNQFVLLGFSHSFVRYAAIYKSEKRYGELKGLLTTATTSIISVSYTHLTLPTICSV